MYPELLFQTIQFYNKCSFLLILIGWICSVFKTVLQTGQGYWGFEARFAAKQK